MSKTIPIIDHHLGTMSCASRLYSTFWKFLIRMKNENSTCLINLIKRNFYVPWLIRVHHQDFQGRSQQHCKIIFSSFFLRGVPFYFKICKWLKWRCQKQREIISSLYVSDIYFHIGTIFIAQVKRFCILLSPCSVATKLLCFWTVYHYFSMLHLPTGSVTFNCAFLDQYYR